MMAKFYGGWNVIRAGAKRATRSFATQKEAIEYGRSISKSHATELVIHDENGRLAGKEFYGKDLNSPKNVRVW